MSPNCAHFRNALETSRSSTVLNQIKFVCNVSQFSKKDFILVLFKKIKKFFSVFFVEYFFENIQNLKIKMFYQKCRLNFVLCNLIFMSVKFHVNNEMYPTRSSPKLRISFEKLSHQFVSSAKLPLRILKGKKHRQIKPQHL